MAPWPLRRAASRAARECDVVLVTTIRCLSRPLPAPTVLDHVDTLSRNMSMRARLGRNPVLRLAARLEARLLRAHETRAASWVAAQAAISSVEAAALAPSPPAIVLPLVWDERAPAVAPVDRDIDVILTGNMRYPPNRDAARWLVAEIVPRLRERRPGIVVRVVGRAASSLKLAGGVEVASDVPDLGAHIARAKVAVVPVRDGTGVPIKLLEAVACGAAVVSTPWAAQASGLDVDTAESPAEFARAVDRLLADEALRARRTAAARAGLEARRPEAVRALLERILIDATGAPTPPSGVRA
jgi:glycosyltransferase involved in cell wall biosynthesis